MLNDTAPIVRSGLVRISDSAGKTICTVAFQPCDLFIGSGVIHLSARKDCVSCDHHGLFKLADRNNIQCSVHVDGQDVTEVTFVDCIVSAEWSESEQSTINLTITGAAQAV